MTVTISIEIIHIISYTSNRQTRKRGNMKHGQRDSLSLGETITSIFIGVFAAFMFMSVFTVADVHGHSMEPTLTEGSKIFVLKYFKPDYNDIVIAISHTSSDMPFYLIKRVIGLPGDTIQFKNNSLYRNGELIDEPYIKEEMITQDMEITLKEDEYFICGDNRNNSTDSRSDKEGCFNSDLIFGKVLLELRVNNKSQN